MKLLQIVFCFAVLGMGVTGCGPMQVPMAPRLDDQGQKKIDEAWDQAVQPVNRYDHQALLDVLLVTRAYQAGVDKLTFRSEKRVATGTVVMEVHYDRAIPGEDRFEVQFVDRDGRKVRKERYSREEVEKTYKELLVEHEQLQQQKRQGTITPEGLQRLASYEARDKAIAEIFPRMPPDSRSNLGSKVLSARPIAGLNPPTVGGETRAFM